ncbi:MAG: hypothetical protein EOP86_07915 [Verrucomicrobiaceae bacterium]|nr:MAG: hypothetical protein EOP86_07915 [Verrucomicrobiaceae bacterium]
MRLQKLSDGAIRLSQLNPWEVQTFRSLPILADFSDHEAAERRMLPTPAVESDLTPDMGMDWVEYVMPELRDSFARNLSTVMEDLENLKTHFPGDLEAGEDGHPAPVHDDDDDGGDSWNWDDDEGKDESQSPSSGNGTGKKESGPPPQAAGTARSQSGPSQELNYSVDIPSDHAELWFRAMNQARLVLSAKHGIDSEHIPDLATLLTSGKLEYWFQYELFVSLQGWLVDAVLDDN